MLISVRHKFALLAVPKTGTTSIEAALRGHCDIIFKGNPTVKHMTMRKYERFMVPYLASIGVRDVETLAVIREPLDWLGSWYRYNSRPAALGKPRSTHEVSFAEFIDGYLSEPQPAYARIGRPSRFLSGMSGKPSVTHLFRYENLQGLIDFLGDRIGTPLELPQLNISPARPLELPEGLEKRLRSELADDYALLEKARAQPSRS